QRIADSRRSTGAWRFGGRFLNRAERKERTWMRALANGKSDWPWSRLGASALGEAADRGGFGVVDVEDREQLGDLQYFLELAAQMAQLKPSSLRLGAMMRGHKDS